MAQSADIERIIRLVEVALIIGRNIVPIMLAIVAVTIALALYNFATSSIAWGIVNSLLGLGGLIFLAQIRQTRRRHHGRLKEYKEMKRQKYREAEAA